jgi:hypothetical protein
MKPISRFIPFIDCNYFKVIISVLILISPGIEAQPFKIQWQQCRGGEDVEELRSIAPAFDGGYILVSTSFSLMGEVSGNHGKSDYWVAKVDQDGNFQWGKCYGGSEDEAARSIVQCSDSGFLIAGFSNSNDGDVSGNHGDFDYWVVKTDPIGNIEWQRSLGGTLSDWAYSALEISPGNYVVAGSSASLDGDVAHPHGNVDAWIVILDDTGGFVHDGNFGGSENEVATQIIKTKDDGYMLLCYTTSTDNDVSFNHGMIDIWLLKLDENFGMQWEKSYGGSDFDVANTIIQTSVGGYAAAGYTDSNNGDVTDNNGGNDGWIFNVDSTGNLLWEKTVGGSVEDFMFGLVEDTTGNILVTGDTWSNDSDIIFNHGVDDLWVTALDSNGMLIWQDCFGGWNFDQSNTIFPASDGGFIIGGNSASTDGDATGNHGTWDCWIVKLAFYDGVSEDIGDEILVYPNPTTDQLKIHDTEGRTKNVEIQNMNGQIILQLRGTCQDDQSIDVSGIDKGIYMLIMTMGDNRKSVRKFVKM